MKIAEVSSTFPPYMGGTGNVCYYNALELAKMGHQVDVITSNFPKIIIDYPESIQVHRYQPVFRIGNAPLILQLLSMKNYDIIHIHFPYFMGDFLTFITAKLRKQKLVITYHNDVILDGWLGTFSDAYNSIVQNFILKRANRVIFTTMDYATNSKKKSILNSIKKTVTDIPNGVDTNRFNPDIDCSEVVKKLHLQDKVVFLFVGGLDKAHFFKGVSNLLQSFERIYSENKFLLIIGDGDLKESYITYANEKNITEKVCFLGMISDQDLPKYYSAADVVILPSTTMGEAFGVVLLEAMATGKPVIASNLPGVRTVVDDGVNGLLVRPGDVNDLTEKMNFLLKYPDTRNSFGIKGRIKAEDTYSWKKIAENLEDLYSDMMDTVN